MRSRHLIRSPPAWTTPVCKSLSFRVRGHALRTARSPGRSRGAPPGSHADACQPGLPEGWCQRAARLGSCADAETWASRGPRGGAGGRRVQGASHHCRGRWPRSWELRAKLSAKFPETHRGHPDIKPWGGQRHAHPLGRLGGPRSPPLPASLPLVAALGDPGSCGETTGSAGLVYIPHRDVRTGRPG